jgi:threonine/homoserine/homoserine lactone efflux protein
MNQNIDLLAVGLFTLAALALLGSPGPGIAALVAVGRRDGFLGGLRFYWGMQAGLALAAGLSAAGLVSAMMASSALATALSWAAAIYLLYLAWQIATAPVGVEVGEGGEVKARSSEGFLLGVANPKAYIAFASLMAANAGFGADPRAAAILKWGLCVAVMVVVDALWLGFGATLKAAPLGPGGARALNLVMGGVIALTAILALR